MTDFDISPGFLDSPQGRIFVIHRFPRFSRARQGVLLVPPFAEEMNRSRRMLTLLAEALAGKGCHVVMPDLFGTGDSEGGFSEASWSGWLEQLACCVHNMKSAYAIESYSLVALRAGALLAADYMKCCANNPEKLLLWQPVIDGAAYLSQFLRLRLTSGMLSGEKERDTASSLKQRLESGGEIEVAGYALTSAISRGLTSASLNNIPYGAFPSTCWVDCVANEGQEPSLAVRKLVQSLREHDVDISYITSVGAPFWGSADIIENYDMVKKALVFIGGSRRDV